MPRYGMVIDLDRCTACQACTVACKSENNVPTGKFWNKVLALGPTGSGTKAKMEYLPRPCMHCESPPCASVCPVRATSKREDGLVVQDYDRCIGCKYCMVACPYGVRSFNDQAPFPEETGGKPAYANPDVPVRPKGVVEKCSFCSHRVDSGQPVPACVQACPAGARLFGDLDDPNSEVAVLSAERRAQRLRPDLGTNPSVYYLR